ncbi:MAG: RNA polymerase sigma factor [Gammaproteobacteria bacterium]|jgi:RNA polymerase sigma-70 factor (ECF subfamily)
MSSTASDEELVSLAVAAGDQRAFGELVRRHQSRVRGWLRHLCGDPAEADDLAQETFLKAWERLNTYAARGRFASWLMKLAYNEFLQAARKGQRRRHLARQFEADALTQGTTADESMSPTGRGTEVPDLPRLLAVLGEEERHVMLLGYGCGFSQAEIGEITGLALGTVKSHMHRGKARIRDAFGLEETP